MSLNPQEQFQKFLKDSKEILVILPPEFQGDFWGASLGLFESLKEMGKKTTIAFEGEINSKFSFLKNPDNQVKEIVGARDFMLSFDTTRNQIGNVRWEKKEDKVNIFVTPEKGSIDPRDFSFVLAKFKYDLVIVVGSPDLDSLGEMYLKNTDLFFEVPVVNIDNKSENENFGKINIVDVTASSCSEIIYSLLAKSPLENLTEDAAQAILAGIISATDRFQRKNTTPKTFYIASELMNQGADQQEIIRWLYKTQPLPLLKLWGRAMAKINWNEDLGLIWSHLSVQDFVESRSNPEILGSILDKLQENYQEGKYFMLIYNDTPSSSVALLKSQQNDFPEDLRNNFETKRSGGYVEIKINTPDIEEACARILSTFN